MKSLLWANGVGLFKSEFLGSYEGLNLMQASHHQKDATEKELKRKKVAECHFLHLQFLISQKIVPFDLGAGVKEMVACTEPFNEF